MLFGLSNSAVWADKQHILKIINIREKFQMKKSYFEPMVKIFCVQEDLVRTSNADPSENQYDNLVEYPW